VATIKKRARQYTHQVGATDNTARIAHSNDASEPVAKAEGYVVRMGADAVLRLCRLPERAGFDEEVFKPSPLAPPSSPPLDISSDAVSRRRLPLVDAQRRSSQRGNF